tara:strand:+ start:641 stop:1432 length:792 start_codon:yes stop_codon:yes gene_type:complete
MVQINKSIIGLKNRLLFAKFVDSFLISVVVGLFVVCVLSFFNVGLFYAFFFGGAVLVRGFYVSCKRASLGEIEKKIPGLRWKLRTAADNVGKNNEILDDLNMEVQEKIGFVGLGELFSRKKTLMGVGGVLVLGFFFGIINMNDVRFDDFVDIGEGEGEGNGVFKGLAGMFSFEGGGDESGMEGDREIYGEESEIEIGEDELELELNAEENIANLDELKNLESKNFKGKNFEGNIGSGQDASYSEKINSEDEEVIKNYFDILNG